MLMTLAMLATLARVDVADALFVVLLVDHV